MSEVALAPAQQEAAAALAQVRAAITEGHSFLVEAGAGAGKTTSLIETVQHLIERRTAERWPTHQHVACITYTNVAKDEIIARIDAHELVQCSTIHGFCWEAIKPFQAQLRKELPSTGTWERRLVGKPPIVRQPVSYELGFPTITEDRITLGHADVLKLMSTLLHLPRFRVLLTDRYPFILIDEYQDSDRVLMSALVEHLAGPQSPAVLGFFGDHWQQIYPGTCGKLDSDDLTVIEKRANFRSAPEIVAVLNRMRPKLPQEPFLMTPGQVAVHHTNDWPVRRLKGGGWDGDLPPDAARAAFGAVQEQMMADPLDAASGPPKTLMLTHQLLGDQQGYGDLVAAVRNSDALSALEDPHLRFLVESVEPACAAFADRRYGEMFERLGRDVPPLEGAGGKARWSAAMHALNEARTSGTVADVLACMRAHERPPVPAQLAEREEELRRLADADERLPRWLQDLPALLQVPYKQVVAFTSFYAETSPFATKHGVKGAEFADVVVVASRGWNQYDWSLMLELAGQPDAALSDDDRRRLTRNRNLFYVACSRATSRLTVLVTEQLSDEALATLGVWFGEDNVHALPPSGAAHA